MRDERTTCRPHRRATGSRVPTISSPRRSTLSRVAGVLWLVSTAGCAGTRAATASHVVDRPACLDGRAVARTVERVVGAQANVGLSIAIAHQGRVASWGFGFADLEDSTRVTARTRFPTASVTKAFTGIALLQAVERGEVDLDVPIQRYVPAFPVQPGGATTLRLLAAHLSGVRHWATERTPALYARHFDDVEAILPLFAGDTLVVPPDSRYSYSSHGYNLIAMALQRASGQPYQELVRRHIIRPLALRNTDFNDVRAVLPHRARNYSYYDLTTFAALESPVRVPDWDYSHNMAGGNIISTAEDLVRLGDAMMRPGLLSPESLRAATSQSERTNVVSPMSFGWFVADAGRPERRFHINGSNAGVQSALYVYPDSRVVIAILSNTWGKGSRSGDLTVGAPAQLPSQLATLCGVRVQ